MSQRVNKAAKRALERLKTAAIVVGTVLDEGERDPTWRESQDLEQAAIALARAVRDESEAR